MSESQHKLIVWDGYGLGNPYSGISHHAAQLFSSLKKLGTTPVVTMPYVGADGPYSRLFEAESIFPQKISQSKLFHSLIKIPKYLKSTEIPSDTKLVYHGLSNFNIPLKKNNRINSFQRIITVHDLIPLIEKKSVSRSLYLQMKLIMGRALEEAEKIICVSEWTQRALLDFFPGTKNKINVIPNGYNPKVEVISALDVSRETNIRMISVGRNESYKRFEFMFSILKSTPNRVSLDVVSDQSIKALAAKICPELIESNRLRVFDSLTDESIAKLYDRADFLIQTSTLEGFCLPAAEIIARGKPVLFTKGSGIDEVVGPCGFGLDKDDTIRRWAEAIVDGAWKIDHQVLENWHKNQKTWDDVALAWSKVYSNI